MLSNPEKPRHPAQDTYDAQRAARQDAFLAAYPQFGNIRATAAAVGISDAVVYGLWNKDPEFKERLALANELHADYLEELALKKVQRMESKDNILHMMLLNGARPEKYRERQQGSAGPVSVTSITINMPDGVKMPLPTPEVTEGSYQELPSSSNPDATDTVTGPDTPVS